MDKPEAKALPPGEWAVVLSHNWNTGETLHTHFEANPCDRHGAREIAEAFMASIRDDFPESDGWIWTLACSDEANSRYADAFVDTLTGRTNG